MAHPRPFRVKFSDWVSILAVLVAALSLWYSFAANNAADRAVKQHHQYAALQLGRAYADLYAQKLANPMDADDAWLKSRLRRLEPLFRAVDIRLDPEAYGVNDLLYDANQGMEPIILDAIVSQSDDASLEFAFDLGLEMQALIQFDVIGKPTYEGYAGKVATQVKSITSRCKALPTYIDDAAAHKSAIGLLNCLFRATAAHAESQQV